jgi:hypothetical protein
MKVKLITKKEKVRSVLLSASSALFHKKVLVYTGWLFKKMYAHKFETCYNFEVKISPLAAVSCSHEKLAMKLVLLQI